ncbi:magnesium-dependent phosphatase 1-like [Babylonia areolata]|uniref:magnesium-dependent phosphatase 1-like n=1 Tax=Babylonia areolata TaxID=304850 RepID=UPI003FD21562
MRRNIFKLLFCLPSVCIAAMAASGSTSKGRKPHLIVFDLDYTLWPFWVDTHVDPPFKMEKNGKVRDVHGREVKYYGDVPEVLRDLHSQGYKLGIASRTSCPEEANDLTRLFNWDQFFHFREIYPGSKVTHFKKLHRDSGIAFEDMMFFDDEHRNIVEVGKLGVTCIFVDSGVTKQVVSDAMQEHEKRRKNVTRKERTDNDL